MEARSQTLAVSSKVWMLNYHLRANDGAPLPLLSKEVAWDSFVSTQKYRSRGPVAEELRIKVARKAIF